MGEKWNMQPFGRSRPQDGRRHHVLIRVHKSEKSAMEKRAKRKRMTVSTYIRQLFYKDFPPLKW